MPLVEDYFRGDVFGGAADSESPALVEDLGKAEVSELDVAIISDEQVFGLEVSEDHILAVQVLEAVGDTGGVEPALVGGEALNRPHVGEQFSPINEFQNQVEVLGVLG